MNLLCCLVIDCVINGVFLGSGVRLGGLEYNLVYVKFLNMVVGNIDVISVFIVIEIVVVVIVFGIGWFGFVFWV